MSEELLSLIMKLGGIEEWAILYKEPYYFNGYLDVVCSKEKAETVGEVLKKVLSAFYSIEVRSVQAIDWSKFK